MSERPLSPHISIYKPQISSVMSIMHRMSGIVLAAGSLLIMLWLWAGAYSQECYVTLQSWAIHPVGTIIMFGWSLAFYYHLCNGIRHLMWDTGRGFEIPCMERSGKLVLVAAVLLTASTWFAVVSG